MRSNESKLACLRYDSVDAAEEWVIREIYAVQMGLAISDL